MKVLLLDKINEELNTEMVFVDAQYAEEEYSDPSFEQILEARLNEKSVFIWVKEEEDKIYCQMVADCSLQYVITDPLTGSVLKLETSDEDGDLEYMGELGNAHVVSNLEFPLTPDLQQDWENLWSEE